MSKELQRLRKLVAKRMVKYVKNGTDYGVRMNKSDSHAYFKAKVNKKKLPELTPSQSSKDPKYSKLSITQFEKKYPW